MCMCAPTAAAKQVTGAACVPSPPTTPPSTLRLYPILAILKTPPRMATGPLSTVLIPTSGISVMWWTTHPTEAMVYTCHKIQEPPTPTILQVPRTCGHTEILTSAPHTASISFLSTGKAKVNQVSTIWECISEQLTTWPMLVLLYPQAWSPGTHTTTKVPTGKPTPSMPAPASMASNAFIFTGKMILRPELNHLSLSIISKLKVSSAVARWIWL